jgi:hypothetical protein
MVDGRFCRWLLDNFKYKKQMKMKNSSYFVPLMCVLCFGACLLVADLALWCSRGLGRVRDCGAEALDCEHNASSAERPSSKMVFILYQKHTRQFAGCFDKFWSSGSV